MLHLKNLDIATSRGAFGRIAIFRHWANQLAKKKSSSEMLALRYIPETNILQRYDFVKEFLNFVKPLLKCPLVYLF
jgi:hypothetical protein